MMEDGRTTDDGGVGMNEHLAFGTGELKTVIIICRF